MVANWIQCNGYIGREGGREGKEGRRGGGIEERKEGEMEGGRIEGRRGKWDPLIHAVVPSSSLYIEILK